VADGVDPCDAEALNERAVAVLRRILAKLTGRDFGEGDRIALMSVGIGLPPGGGAGGGQLSSPPSYPGGNGDRENLVSRQPAARQVISLHRCLSRTIL